ncbi:MAG: SDR family NAD(P)-dependent oxidoreductase [Sulfolobales archaeon]|nr:SDR family NAD(P)-dependent oxidoreductase [Sulfolobales archaeon]MCX8186115.1 SDR family NAD(P)-dependent oxidoreductase [Sulfolobales archaeon]MDW7969410.1 SDR family NAD(P)-dependent oxidoreductase [Sulfolobales archaeon]
MRILITGGAGFIGHYLATYLTTLGHDVTCLDNLSRASKDAVDILRNNGIELIVSDVTDFNSLSAAVGLVRPDVIVHAAALISVEESLEKPKEYFEVNFMGTLNVVRAMERFNVSRIIYVSSAAVYGNPVKLPINEDHPTNPRSPYGLSKLFGEGVVKLFSQLNNFEHIILRLFNVYGPRQKLTHYSGVIVKFVHNVMNDLPLTIYGDGEQTRDFIHVIDVCRAVELSLTTKHFNEIYNVGSGVPTSIKELANMVQSIKKSKAGIVYEPPRAGDILHSYADISKATKLLGFRPSINIVDGIKELLKLR